MELDDKGGHCYAVGRLEGNGGLVHKKKVLKMMFVLAVLLGGPESCGNLSFGKLGWRDDHYLTL